MAGKTRKNSKREELIKAGLAEINEYGVAGFSVRRVAEACGVSSGAPYKHFGNKTGFEAAMIEYVNAQWSQRQQAIVENNPDSTRKQLVEFSVEYVKFLVDNPHFRSILMLKDDKFDDVYQQMRGRVSTLTQQLVQKYCAEVNMSQEVQLRKLYIVRALIYGAALMFDNGQLPYNTDTVAIVRNSIDREFDLP